MRSGWDTSRETPHELPRVHRASVRVLGPRADAAGGAGDPSAPRRLPPVRRALRLRTAVPRLSPSALPRAGRALRAQAPHSAGAVRRVSWLTPGGLAAALAVGAAVAWGFGWQGLVVLFAFFLSGSLLTLLAERRAPRRNARQVIANGGVAALLSDSLLGARVQAKYECPACDARFERGNSGCPEPVLLTRGWRWLDNDGVNLAATLVGATVAALGGVLKNQ